mmetsp:Transcript_34481/g.48130  ORF Transcript_34481/g.48130 Transcript_34481/m.48130 type:complete len:105 (-) Transcript_34481:57-371(-)
MSTPPGLLSTAAAAATSLFTLMMEIELSALGKRLGDAALSLGPVLPLEDVLVLCDDSTSDEGDAYDPTLDGVLRGVLRDEDRLRLFERTESWRWRGRGRGRLSN